MVYFTVLPCDLLESIADNLKNSRTSWPNPGPRSLTQLFMNKSQCLVLNTVNDQIHLVYGLYPLSSLLKTINTTFRRLDLFPFPSTVRVDSGLRLSLSKESNNPHIRTEIDAISETLCFLII
jgi:hypothetical protein